MDRELENLLRAECVGPLYWQPPVGVTKALDGSRRGGVHDGFSVKVWGPSTSGPQPTLTERRLTFAEALDLAATLDKIGTTPRDRSSRGFPSTVAWVRAIVAAIPQAYESAISDVEHRLAELREQRAQAQGFVAGLATAPVPDDDGDVPF